ncbi:hypothetical protein NLM33_22430 [Bradyrhizobium sp. CCGUVB1N3]|uniref:hypothetical protein n=1 Tax=Bradyrhizobium sp. CCGUVB1N3 TaxID=2949629 RepID=UPI0020B2515E|nr:hypothetical protein [Bradyrhizobium sp. CCGUVB1N3]MCP3473079.1 hypothetical protein [Bradyrhizobium sp. CCGUVB1N3]
MTASNLSRASAQSSQASESITNCKPKNQSINQSKNQPMSHQNSGDHGYEMYPQQFVRLVGCHDVHAPSAAEKEKLH